jgi:hypothetical protein
MAEVAQKGKSADNLDEMRTDWPVKALQLTVAGAGE